MFFTPSCFTPSPLKYDIGSIFAKRGVSMRRKRKNNYDIVPKPKY